MAKFQNLLKKELETIKDDFNIDSKDLERSFDIVCAVVLAKTKVEVDQHKPYNYFDKEKYTKWKGIGAELRKLESLVIKAEHNDYISEQDEIPEDYKRERVISQIEHEEYRHKVNKLIQGGLEDEDL